MFILIFLFLSIVYLHQTEDPRHSLQKKMEENERLSTITRFSYIFASQDFTLNMPHKEHMGNKADNH